MRSNRRGGEKKENNKEIRSTYLDYRLRSLNNRPSYRYIMIQ